MSDPERFHRDREAEAKLAQKRVDNVEKHLGQICATVGSITRKNARLRDKGDLLARNLISFAESDKLNSTTRSNMLHFAENYAAVQDYCHAKVQRMETKVVKPLMKYGELCRYVKRSIKSEITACGKEKKILQKLDKLQGKGDNPTQIVELELDKVQGEEQVVGEAMEMEVDKFEKDKLKDIKSVLTELVQIEMLYHAKALEYLSKCFESVEQISVQDDLDEFRAAMVKTGSRRRGSQTARSQKMRLDASTLTTTGSTARSSTTRSSDTRASGTFSSSSMSSLSRSRLSQQSQQAAPGRQQHIIQPSPRPRQSPQGRPSPRVRISGMYQDADDEDTDDDEYED